MTQMSQKAVKSKTTNPPTNLAPQRGCLEWAANYRERIPIIV